MLDKNKQLFQQKSDYEGIKINQLEDGSAISLKYDGEIVLLAKREYSKLLNRSKEFVKLLQEFNEFKRKYTKFKEDFCELQSEYSRLQKQNEANIIRLQETEAKLRKFTDASKKQGVGRPSALSEAERKHIKNVLNANIDMPMQSIYKSLLMNFDTSASYETVRRYVARLRQDLQNQQNQQNKIMAAAFREFNKIQN
jgi:transposase